MDAQPTSLRRACRLVGLSTATWRYQRRGRVDNVALLERLQAHAAVRARYGAWVYANGVELRFIRPGKPIENAYVESFNGKFRDECLNEHWFVSLADAKAIIEAWRVDDNTVRPHDSLGQLTPAAYAAAACADPKPGCGACSAAALATTDQRHNSGELSLSV